MKKEIVKVGTKEEVYWTQVKDSTEKIIEADEKSIKLNKEILKIAKEKILLEQRK